MFLLISEQFRSQMGFSWIWTQATVMELEQMKNNWIDLSMSFVYVRYTQ